MGTPRWVGRLVYYYFQIPATTTLLYFGFPPLLIVDKMATGIPAASNAYIKIYLPFVSFFLCVLGDIYRTVLYFG